MIDLNIVVIKLFYLDFRFCVVINLHEVIHTTGGLP
jgi:hypothetical protein